MFNIVLLEPEIPQNTGNIARTCAATGARLHLIEPMGFSIEDKWVRRAGLDYWHLVDIIKYGSLEEFKEGNAKAPFFYITTKGGNAYSDIEYPNESYFIFGKETKGLPEELLRANPDRCVRIPMREEARSLNLSNSVAVILYEALRQKDFRSLKISGQLQENPNRERG